MLSKIKISSTLCLFFIFISFSFAQDWNLVWSDEFESEGAINSEKWFHQTLLPNGYSWYNSELQHYTNQIENSYVEDGLLKIVAIKEDFYDQGQTKQYTSARLNSKFAFQYGKVEVRAKLPTGQGTWPAIWTLGKNIIEPGGYWTSAGFGTTSWPACGEIDIMEHWGSNQNYTQSATHTPSSFGGTINHGGQTIQTASTQLHTYTLVWTAEKLVFSVDDVVHYTYNPPVKDSETWPFDAEQYLLLNIAIAPDIDPNFVESSLEIDYVRVYQGGEDSYVEPGNVLGCMDGNAMNYNPNATIQALDTWGNMLCTYSGCNEVPSEGCMYSDAFAGWNEYFDAADCVTYGGTPCEGGSSGGPGCLDANAINYNPAATSQAEDEWGNALCTYASCDDVPTEGCMYSNAFAGWHDNFDAADCVSYGGTACEGGSVDVSGCLDVNATNYNANASLQAEDQYGNLLCTYTSCNETPGDGCMYTDSWGIYNEWFSAADCSSYGGTPCEENSIVYGCIDQAAENFNADATEDDGSCEYQCDVNWNVIVTDQNHSIFIDGSWTDINGFPLIEGSSVGVFYENENGDLACAGYTTMTQGVVQISVMGDDASTDEIDGLIPGQEFTYRIWNISSCEEYNAILTYLNGPETYTPNGISFVNSVAAVPLGPNEQIIDLTLGWSIFSTYMIPADIDIISVLAPIVNNVIIAKDYSGLAYLPEWSFNGIGDIQIGQGYQIKTTATLELTIGGAYAFPEVNPIEFTAGWSIIGYLRTEAAPADLVLADLVTEENLIIAKNSSGLAYLPEWNFNGIGDMLPGEGYQIKTNTAGTMQYLSNTNSY